MTISMRAGTLRHRVTIQRDDGVVGSRGQRVPDWTDVEIVSASIETLNGNEAELAHQLVPTAMHKITVRWNCNVTTRRRFKFGSRIFHIGHVENVEERNVQMSCLCTEEK